MSNDTTSSSEAGDLEILEDLDSLHMLNELHVEMQRERRRKRRDSVLSGAEWVNELITSDNFRIYDCLRMNAATFQLLADTLRRGGMVDDLHTHVLVEEALTIFLYIVGHSERHRIAAERFQYSGETICRQFHRVRIALERMGIEIIRSRDGNNVHPHILDDHRFYPWFENCVGAIDGTLIKVTMPSSQHNAYRTRKSTISQNVLATCDFDMCFTFINAGWEGSAHDAKILAHVLHDQDAQFPMPSAGHFYVADCGYPNMPGFLAPYRRVRYHLKEYNNENAPAPQNAKELFNLRHACLRNVIERCFGVLKNRFRILDTMPNYKPLRQGPIVTACCAVHNFIRLNTLNDPLFEEYFDGERFNLNDNEDVELTEVRTAQAAAAEMANVRDVIAETMWQAYNNE